jgi:hypothetical protein
MAGSMMNPMSGGKRKPAPKTLEHMRLSRGADGSLNAQHNFTSYDHQPEIHQFDSAEGKKFLEHIKKHMGIEMKEEKGEKEGKGEKMAKGGKAAEEKEDKEEEGED